MTELNITLTPHQVVALTDDRRATCLLCAGRCDPGRWTCRECHRRVIEAVCRELVDEAKGGSHDGR